MTAVETIQPPAPQALAVDAKAAAKMLSVGRTCWLGLVSSGRAPAGVKLGRRHVWPTAELSAWLNAGCPNRDKWERMQK